jgi:hypothetical protein
VVYQQKTYFNRSRRCHADESPNLSGACPDEATAWATLLVTVVCGRLASAPCALEQASKAVQVHAAFKESTLMAHMAARDSCSVAFTFTHEVKG